MHGLSLFPVFYLFLFYFFLHFIYFFFLLFIVCIYTHISFYFFGCSNLFFVVSFFPTERIYKNPLPSLRSVYPLILSTRSGQNHNKSLFLSDSPPTRIVYTLVDVHYNLYTMHDGVKRLEWFRNVCVLYVCMYTSNYFNVQ